LHLHLPWQPLGISPLLTQLQWVDQLMLKSMAHKALETVLCQAQLMRQMLGLCWLVMMVAVVHLMSATTCLHCWVSLHLLASDAGYCEAEDDAVWHSVFAL